MGSWPGLPYLIDATSTQATWIVALFNSDSAKLVQLIVSVTGGTAYVYASGAAYANKDTLRFWSAVYLETTPSGVNALFQGPNVWMPVAESPTDFGFGIQDLTIIATGRSRVCESVYYCVVHFWFTQKNV